VEPGPDTGAEQVDRHLLVIVGATGDLYRRKLLPAMYQLLQQYDLIDRCVLLGVATSGISEEAFREMSHEALEDAGHFDVDCAAWCEQVLHYQSVSKDADSYAALAERVGELDANHDLGSNRIFYLALPPSAFGPVLESLDEVGLATSQGWTRVVVEKPFGHDLDTAVELNAKIHEHFDESQIYRIDHYLGKATVQNLLVFRFANSLFESNWHRERIDNVQITVAESLGIGTRAGYYDRSGAMRDMVQNHLTQVLSLVAMEPPVSFDAEAIRDEKVKVLHSIRPIDETEVVRGQYGPSDEFVAYVDEDSVSDESETETYAAIRLFIDNWRWQGVPFYLRTGKRLPTRLTQIAVTFKDPPVSLFRSFERDDSEKGNVLYITLQPHEGFDLLFDVKAPSDTPRLATLPLDFDYEDFFGDLPGAYETLLFDVMTGDQTLFVRSDEVERAWELFTPLLDPDASPDVYPAGSWGPVVADRLPYQDGTAWRVRVRGDNSR
jgi:glucose-6-phosphate 1-dehydrogenase